MCTKTPRLTLTIPKLTDSHRGSIKAHVGHLEGGAGLAGIVKAIMVLERGIIPPNALFEKLNPDIDAEFYHTAVSFGSRKEHT